MVCLRAQHHHTSPYRILPTNLDAECRSTEGSGDSFYLFNHSTANATLSNGARGLMMSMSNIPCKWNASDCQGAAMASAHVSSTVKRGYGDFEVKMRAPHSTGANPTVCDSGIYGYFTAGYVGHPKWNEMNFGFHPDRDASETKISCEAHADAGGYQETRVDLHFNYRDAFHDYTIRHRHDGIFWLVDGKQVHALKGTDSNLSYAMGTSLILRTNKHGTMPAAIMEVEYFRFTPEAAVLAREQAAAAAAAAAATTAPTPVQ
jgi:beta-glucanase (GH16 family)